MKKDELKKAANDFSEREYEVGDIDKDALHKGFYHGAQWRILSVWHDASEKPVLGENIIIEIKYDNGIKDYILPLRGDHPNVITDEQGICYLLLNAKVVRWAYVKDLMPEFETK